MQNEILLGSITAFIGFLFGFATCKLIEMQRSMTAVANAWEIGFRQTKLALGRGAASMITDPEKRLELYDELIQKELQLAKYEEAGRKIKQTHAK